MSEQPAPLDARIVRLSPQPTAAVRVQKPMSGIDVGALIDRYLPAVIDGIGQAGGRPAGPPYVRYHEWGGDRADLELGFPVVEPSPRMERLDGRPSGRVGAAELPGGEAALTVHCGPYDQLSGTYAALHDWIHAQGRDDGPGPWESYVDDPGAVTDPANVRTEVYWPIR